MGVQALDRLTVRVELNHPTLFFLDICAMPVACVVPRQAIEQHGDRWLSVRPLPVSGPYELAAWRLNDKVRLERNPRYWDAANTQSRIIDLLPVGSPDTALNLYERGQADIVWDKELIPSELMDVLFKRPDFHTFPIWARISSGSTSPANRLMTSGCARRLRWRWTNRASSEKSPAPANSPRRTSRRPAPPITRRLKASATIRIRRANSWPKPVFPAARVFRALNTFLTPGPAGMKIDENIAIELQQMWHDELGVEMELRPVESQVFWGTQSRLDYTVSKSTWIADYNDANTFLGMFLTGDGNNETGWSNAQYDELVHAANETTDAGAREKLFQQAETILVRDELPIVPLYIYAGINYLTQKIPAFTKCARRHLWKTLGWTITR